MAGTVRKITWTTRKGETRTAWQATYFDQDRKRYRKSFATRKAADAWLTLVKTEIVRGVHTPDAGSITIAEAAELWLSYNQAKGLERTTIANYRSAVDRHILPSLGRLKLTRLTRPIVEAFSETLHGRLGRHRRSAVVSCLKSLLGDAQRRGLVAQNVATGLRLWRNKREDRKIEIGGDVPSKAEIRELLDAAGSGKSYAFLMTAAFTGLRISELLGLTWDDVDFEHRVLHVRRRVSRLNEVGLPKSQAGQRSVPLAPLLVRALREWRLQCPRILGAGDLRFVFPGRAGRHGRYWSTVERMFHRVQTRAGWEERRNFTAPRYRFHSLRHFAASYFIEQGFAPKRIQEMMGHTSVTITFDRYGHLFPNYEDDQARLAKGEAEMFGSGNAQYLPNTK
jgi:integrase